MALKHAILSRLSHGQARTGYQLAGWLTDLNEATWHASPSQVYSELKKMESSSLIAATDLEDRAGRSYEITDQGREELRRWLRTVEVDRSVRNDALLRMLMVWMLDTTTARHLIESEITFYRRRLMAVRELLTDWDPRKVEPIFRFRYAGLLLWTAQDETMVAWLQRLIDVLEKPDVSVADLYAQDPAAPPRGLEPTAWQTQG